MSTIRAKFEFDPANALQCEWFRAQRDCIVKLVRAGHKQNQIAKALGLSKQRVGQIVAAERKKDSA
jgi:hypothetical protein